MKGRSVTRTGFTLIELLVVIAIISILASILFPVFSKAREKARQISCLSNEKQLGLAFMQYQQDYDEQLPSGNAPSSAPAGWAGEVYSYVKTPQIFRCSDDTTNPASTQSNAYPISYAMNQDCRSAADSTLQSPSNTVLLFEVQGYAAQVANGGEMDSPMGDAQQNALAPSGTIDTGGTGAYATGKIGGHNMPVIAANNGTVHNDGSNYLAADDHVKFLRPEKVSGGPNAASSDDSQDENGGAAGEASGTNAMRTIAPIVLTFSVN